jgi:hypothetical protein
MDAIDHLNKEIDGAANGQPSEFQHFDLGHEEERTDRVTRADLKRLEHRLLSAIDGNTTSVTATKPQDDAQQDEDEEERAEWRSKALRWRKHGTA